MGANKSKQEYLVAIECVHSLPQDERHQAYMKRLCTSDDHIGDDISMCTDPPVKRKNITENIEQNIQQHQGPHHQQQQQKQQPQRQQRVHTPEERRREFVTPPKEKLILEDYLGPRLPPPSSEQRQKQDLQIHRPAPYERIEYRDYSNNTDNTDDTDTTNAKIHLPTFATLVEKGLREPLKYRLRPRKLSTVSPTKFDGVSDDEYTPKFIRHTLVDKDCYQETLNGYNSYIPLNCEEIVHETGEKALKAKTTRETDKFKPILMGLVKELISESTKIGTFLNVRYLAWLIDLYAYQHKMRRRYIVCEYINDQKWKQASGYTQFPAHPHTTEHGRPVVVTINNLHFLKGDLLKINILRATVLAHEMAHAAQFIFQRQRTKTKNEDQMHGPAFKLHADHIVEFTGLLSAAETEYDQIKLAFSVDDVRSPPTNN